MRLENTIAIAAPPELVWSVSQDIERWPEWTSTVTAASRLDNGPFGLGSVALLKQPTQPEATWTVTEFVPGERFSWETRRPGLHFVGSHHVIPEGGATRNELRVDAHGVLSILLWPVLWLGIRKAIADENRGLKARCEALAGSGSAQ